MVIKKTKSGYTLKSRKINPKTGKRKNLGKFSSKKAAAKREGQIHYFKNLKK